jgi:ribosomal protein L9
MLEVSNFNQVNVKVGYTNTNNFVILNNRDIMHVISSLTSIQESIEKEEKLKQAQERKVNRAMERLEQIASVLNYKIVDSKEHFILIDLDELKESQVLPLIDIIRKLVKIYVSKLVILNVLSTYDEILCNKKTCKIIEELQEIEKILVK